MVSFSEEDVLMRIPKNDTDESMMNVDQSRLLREKEESSKTQVSSYKSPTVREEKLKDNSDLIVIDSDFVMVETKKDRLTEESFDTVK